MTLLAVSVWAADAWVQTAASGLSTGDLVVIVDKTSAKAMSNDKGTSNAPDAIDISFVSNQTQIAAPVEKIQWEVTVNNGSYQFNVPGTTNYLYCTNNNNGVRVGTNSNNVFTIYDNNGVPFLLNTATSRYLGVYNNSDWRCYTTIGTNIQSTVLAFYKKVDSSSYVATPDITLDPAEGPYYEGSTVTANITCATEGATISYSTDGETWIEGTTVTLTQTTTLRAKAALDGTESGVAEKTVTFVAQPSGLVDELTHDVIGVDGNSYTIWQNVVGTSGTVYAGNTAGGNNAIQMRTTNNNSGIVSTSSVGNIKSVTLTWNSNTAEDRKVDIYGSNTAFTQATDLYDASTQGTLLGTLTMGEENQTINVEGEYAFIGIRSKSGALYLDAISIEWQKVDAEVATPVITLDPAEGPYYEGTSVTANITCETEDAAIYYSTDGGETWTEGTTLIVTQSCTINAKATLGDNESNIASKTVTFVPAPITVATIAEFNALDDETSLTFNGTVNVIAQKDNYLYVQDDNKGMLIFGNVSQEYTMGDVIPAGFTGKKVTYKGAPEMSNPAGLAAPASTTTLTPIEITPAEVNLDNAFRYAVIKNATIVDGNIVVGDESVDLYNGRFNIEIPEDDKTYDIVGIVGYYDAPQFMPMSITEVVVPKYYAINVGTLENGTVTADPTEATIGETVTLTVTPAEGYKLNTIAVKAGYMSEATPAAGINLLAEGEWVEQANIEPTKVDDTTYTFVLPEDMEYNDATEFRVEATFIEETPSTAIESIYVNFSSNARYVNSVGQVSDRPFKGFNIVIDGDKTYKIIVK